MKTNYPVKSILFVGTRQIGADCLRHLISTINGSDTKIVGVLTTNKQPQWWTPECPEDVWQVAEKYQLPLVSEDDLYGLNYDVLFCAIYLKIFPKKLLEKANLFNINLHPGPVPNYRGCWGYQHSIINNETEYGASLHYMDERIDAGDIIEVKKFPILSTYTAKDVYQQTLLSALELFKKWLPALLNNTLSGINQLEYAKKNKLDNKCYSFNSINQLFEKPQQPLSAADKNKLIRALSFPPLYQPPTWLYE